MVSAESRLAAVSKLSRVRVESSKKSDTTVRPRRAGTFGIWRCADLDEGVGEVKQLVDAVATSGPRSAIESRLRESPCRREPAPGRLT